MSNNLSLDQMASHQSSPEVTHNTSNGQIDAAITELLQIDLTSGNATPTATQHQRNFKFLMKNASVARNVTLAGTVKRHAIFEADAGNSAVVSLKCGTTTITFNPGEAKLIYTDGTANGMVQYPFNPAGGIPYDVGFFMPGSPLASQEVMRYEVVRPFTWPVSLTGSKVKSRVTATGSTTFTINQNGSSIGSFNFAAAASTATFTFASAVTFAAGDQITIVAPVTPDASLADIGANFLGTR